MLPIASASNFLLFQIVTCQILEIQTSFFAGLPFYQVHDHRIFFFSGKTNLCCVKAGIFISSCSILCFDNLHHDDSRYWSLVCPVCTHFSKVIICWEKVNCFLAISFILDTHNTLVLGRRKARIYCFANCVPTLVLVELKLFIFIEHISDVTLTVNM